MLSKWWPDIVYKCREARNFPLMDVLQAEVGRLQGTVSAEASTHLGDAAQQLGGSTAYAATAQPAVDGGSQPQKVAADAAAAAATKQDTAPNTEEPARLQVHMLFRWCCATIVSKYASFRLLLRLKLTT